GIVGVALVGGRVLVRDGDLLARVRTRIRGLHVRLGVGLGGDMGGFGLLHAYVLRVAGLVVALLLRHRIVGVRLGDARVVAGFLRRLVRRGEIGQRDILLALGFGDADVLRVGLERVARGFRGLVFGLDALLAGFVIRLRH